MLVVTGFVNPPLCDVDYQSGEHGEGVPQGDEPPLGPQQSNTHRFQRRLERRRRHILICHTQTHFVCIANGHQMGGTCFVTIDYYHLSWSKTGGRGAGVGGTVCRCV